MEHSSELSHVKAVVVPTKAKKEELELTARDVDDRQSDAQRDFLYDPARTKQFGGSVHPAPQTHTPTLP